MQKQKIEKLITVYRDGPGGLMGDVKLLIRDRVKVDPNNILEWEISFQDDMFFHSWHVAFVNYSHKNKDIDEALDICNFAMAKTKRKFSK